MIMAAVLAETIGMFLPFTEKNLVNFNYGLLILFASVLV